MAKHDKKGIHCPSQKDDRKMFEKNNRTIALNVLHAKNDKTHLSCLSKYNSNYEEQVTLLMISNKEVWHYIVEKNYRHKGGNVKTK